MPAHLRAQLSSAVRTLEMAQVGPLSVVRDSAWRFSGLHTLIFKCGVDLSKAHNHASDEKLTDLLDINLPRLRVVCLRVEHKSAESRYSSSPSGPTVLSRWALLALAEHRRLERLDPQIVLRASDIRAVHGHVRQQPPFPQLRSLLAMVDREALEALVPMVMSSLQALAILPAAETWDRDLPLVSAVLPLADQLQCLRIVFPNYGLRPKWSKADLRAIAALHQLKHLEIIDPDPRDHHAYGRQADQAPPPLEDTDLLAMVEDLPRLTVLRLDIVRKFTARLFPMVMRMRPSMESLQLYAPLDPKGLVGLPPQSMASLTTLVLDGVDGRDYWSVSEIFPS
jgi:hypothetical protein